MKRVFAICGLMAGTAVANDFKFDTKDLQDKMMQDMTAMIQNYDFSSILEEAVDSTTAHVIQKQSDQMPTIEELLGQLSDALKNQQAELWPNAPLKDQEMLEHINIEFDLHSGKILAETAARDNHGNPKYEYIFDSNSQNSVQIEQIDQVSQTVVNTNVNAITEEVVVAPVAPVEEIVPEVIDSVDQTNDAPVIVIPDADLTPAEPMVDSVEQRVLSIEEQREIALRVTMFFFCLIGGTFIVLYAYHKIEQRTKEPGKRQTFFEFMAGQADPDSKLPVYANVNSRFAV